MQSLPPRLLIPRSCQNQGNGLKFSRNKMCNIRQAVLSGDRSCFAYVVLSEKIVNKVLSQLPYVIYFCRDTSFPRLGQMILDYENPMRKMTEEFVPHSRVMIPGLLSLHNIYSKCTLSAEQMRAAQVLSLIAEPSKIMNVPTTTVVSMTEIWIL